MMANILELFPALKKLPNATEVPHHLQAWTPAGNFQPREDEIAIPSSMGPGTRQSDLPTSPPPQAFWRLKKLDPTANAMDYWVKAHDCWDAEGIISDIALCRKFLCSVFNSLKIHQEFLADGPFDAKKWLNNKIANQATIGQKPDQYFQALTVTLQLFMQETADNAEIAVSNLLGKLSTVGRETQRMEDDQRDAASRVAEIIDAHERVNTVDDDPKKTLAQVNEAQAKIELIRRAIKRRK
jgi:hypothetical protein